MDRINRSITLGEGCVGGILQICLGPSKIGQKVVFTREVVHVNGLNMRKADLGHVLRPNDKVQVQGLLYLKIHLLKF